LPHDYGTVSPLVHSDLYFDLGHFNEAKRWAHEAASVRGESVWNVQRLALTYLIYDHRQAAELYFRKLEKTLFHKKWALRFRPFWSGQKPIASDPYLSSLIKSRVDHDALTFNDYPEKDLQILLAQNPENQFARDYMLADLLMRKQLKQFADAVKNQGLLRMGMLPRHYQEALVFYLTQTAETDDEWPAFRPNNDVLTQFKEFQNLYAKNRKNLQNAQYLFEASFNNTYWYYLLFHSLGKED